MSSAFMSSRLVTWEHLASFQKCLALLTRTQSIIIFHNSLMKVAQISFGATIKKRPF